MTSPPPRSPISALELLPTVRAAIKAARTDVNAFLEYCFQDTDGEPIRQAAIHTEVQAFLTGHRHALIELPRDHGKSVQACGRLVWELGRRPGLRVKVVCATDALAAERTRFLRDAIAGNRRVRQVFPDLKPGEPWSAEAFTVERPAEAIGPSVAAFGLGTGATGARADLLVCDDVVDVRALHSRQERERAKDCFRNNLFNLLEPDGRFWGLCTPWHPDDLNAELKANPTFALFRRAVGPDLEPVWPEKWSTERLKDRRAEIGEAGFARGYRLTPLVESDLLIRPEWLREWADDEDEPSKVILSIDPAVTASAKSDASALVALAMMPGRNEVRVLEATAYRVTLPDLVPKIAAAVQRWNPAEVLFESNAVFAGIRDLLVRHAAFGPRVRSVVQSRSKAARFAAFAVAVENGTVRFRKDAQRELVDEMTAFPHGRHDDLTDACATGVEHLLGTREPRIWV